MSTLHNSLYLSHEYIKKVVREGSVVIDATAGNGNDTVFLAELVGKDGKVYSFDIQEVALEKTREKLTAKGLGERVNLILDGHENIHQYVAEKVDAVMFNLGYRPGGDHRIGTVFETTRMAIEQSMALLSENGLITIVIYYGGDSGFEEKNAILKYLETIDAKLFSVLRADFVNQVNCPPILVCIERNS